MKDSRVVSLQGAIDRSSPVPLYYQLREYLAQLIRNGEWPPDTQVPTEQELCEMTKLSRSVVRQALQDLVHDQLLVRYRAKGTFVARPKVHERLVQTLTGFYEDTVARGQVPQTRVLQFDVIPASSLIARELGIAPGTPVIHLNRLRSIDGEPILLVVTYIPHYMCPGLIEEDMTSQSLYRVLEERYGLAIVRGRRTLGAVAATNEEAGLLQIEPGDPLLLLRSTSYLEDGRALEYFVARHRADRAEFEVELVRPSRRERES